MNSPNNSTTVPPHTTTLSLSSVEQLSLPKQSPPISISLPQSSIQPTLLFSSTLHNDNNATNNKSQSSVVISSQDDHPLTQDLQSSPFILSMYNANETITIPEIFLSPSAVPAGLSLNTRPIMSPPNQQLQATSLLQHASTNALLSTTHTTNLRTAPARSTSSRNPSSLMKSNLRSNNSSMISSLPPSCHHDNTISTVLPLNHINQPLSLNIPPITSSLEPDNSTNLHNSLTSSFQSDPTQHSSIQLSTAHQQQLSDNNNTNDNYDHNNNSNHNQHSPPHFESSLTTSKLILSSLHLDSATPSIPPNSTYPIPPNANADPVSLPQLRKLLLQTIPLSPKLLPAYANINTSAIHSINTLHQMEASNRDVHEEASTAFSVHPSDLTQGDLYSHSPPSITPNIRSSTSNQQHDQIKQLFNLLSSNFYSYDSENDQPIEDQSTLPSIQSTHQYQHFDSHVSPTSVHFQSQLPTQVSDHDFVDSILPDKPLSEEQQDFLGISNSKFAQTLEHAAILAQNSHSSPHFDKNISNHNIRTARNSHFEVPNSDPMNTSFTSGQFLHPKHVSQLYNSAQQLLEEQPNRLGTPVSRFTSLPGIDIGSGIQTSLGQSVSQSMTDSTTSTSNSSQFHPYLTISPPPQDQLQPFGRESGGLRSSQAITGSSNDLQELQHNLARFQPLHAIPSTTTYNQPNRHLHTSSNESTLSSQQHHPFLPTSNGTNSTPILFQNPNTATLSTTHISSTSSISRGTPYRPQYKKTAHKRKEIFSQHKKLSQQQRQQQQHQRRHCDKHIQNLNTNVSLDGVPDDDTISASDSVTIAGTNNYPSALSTSSTTDVYSPTNSSPHDPMMIDEAPNTHIPNLNCSKPLLTQQSSQNQLQNNDTNSCINSLHQHKRPKSLQLLTSVSSTIIPIPSTTVLPDQSSNPQFKLDYIDVSHNLHVITPNHQLPHDNNDIPSNPSSHLSQSQDNFPIDSLHSISQFPHTPMTPISKTKMPFPRLHKTPQHIFSSLPNPASFDNNDSRRPSTQRQTSIRTTATSNPRFGISNHDTNTDHWDIDGLSNVNTANTTATTTATTTINTDNDENDNDELNLTYNQIFDLVMKTNRPASSIPYTSHTADNVSPNKLHHHHHYHHHHHHHSPSHPHNAINTIQSISSLYDSSHLPSPLAIPSQSPHININVNINTPCNDSPILTSHLQTGLLEQQSTSFNHPHLQLTNSISQSIVNSITTTFEQPPLSSSTATSIPSIPKLFNFNSSHYTHTHQRANLPSSIPVNSSFLHPNTISVTSSMANTPTDSSDLPGLPGADLNITGTQLSSHYTTSTSKQENFNKNNENKTKTKKPRNSAQDTKLSPKFNALFNNETSLYNSANYDHNSDLLSNVSDSDTSSSLDYSESSVSSDDLSPNDFRHNLAEHSMYNNSPNQQKYHQCAPSRRESPHIRSHSLHNIVIPHQIYEQLLPFASTQPLQLPPPVQQQASLLDLLFNFSAQHSPPLIPTSYPPHHYLIISTVGTPLVGKSLVLLKLFRFLSWIRYSPFLISLSQQKDLVNQWWQQLHSDNANVDTESNDYQSEALDLRNVAILQSFLQITQALSNGVRIILYDGSNGNVTSRTLLREFLTRLGISYTIFWIELQLVDNSKDVLINLEKQYNKTLLQQRVANQQQQDQTQQQDQANSQKQFSLAELDSSTDQSIHPHLHLHLDSVQHSTEEQCDPLSSLLEKLDDYQSLYQSLTHSELDEELKFQQELLSFKQHEYHNHLLRKHIITLLQQTSLIHSYLHHSDVTSSLDTLNQIHGVHNDSKELQDPVPDGLISRSVIDSHHPHSHHPPSHQSALLNSQDVQNSHKNTNKTAEQIATEEQRLQFLDLLHQTNEQLYSFQQQYPDVYYQILQHYSTTNHQFESTSSASGVVSSISQLLQPVPQPSNYPNSECYCTIIDGGLESRTYLISGWLLTKVVYYLLNLQTNSDQTPLYFSRHGESRANVNNLVGTDFGLSSRGFLFAEELGQWMRRHLITMAQQRLESKIQKRLLKQKQLDQLQLYPQSPQTSAAPKANVNYSQTANMIPTTQLINSVHTLPSVTTDIITALSNNNTTTTTSSANTFDVTIYCSTLCRAISTTKFVYDELVFGGIQQPYPEEYNIDNSLYYRPLKTNSNQHDHVDLNILPPSHPYFNYKLNNLAPFPFTSSLFTLAEKAIQYKLDVVKWRSLVEIDAGLYEGLSYQQIEKTDPIGYKNRNDDKLNYRYPSGESYKDVIDRLERVVFELERVHNSSLVLVIAHQAVIRCLLGFFLNCDLNTIPHIDVPLNTVIKVDSNRYPANLEYIRISQDIKDDLEQRNELYNPLKCD